MRYDTRIERAGWRSMGIVKRNDINLLDRNLWETLFVNQVVDFYGVDHKSFAVGTNGKRIVLEALEDPDDGYRSYFGCLLIAGESHTFSRAPIARVTIIELDEPRFKGWALRDTTDSHEWLRVGTDFTDDYYPLFTFDYIIPGRKHEF